MADGARNDGLRDLLVGKQPCLWETFFAVRQEIPIVSLLGACGSLFFLEGGRRRGWFFSSRATNDCADNMSPIRGGDGTSMPSGNLGDTAVGAKRS